MFLEFREHPMEPEKCMECKAREKFDVYIRRGQKRVAIFGSLFANTNEIAMEFKSVSAQE